MTPKEKAKELIERAEYFIYTSQAHFADEDAAKNCAMMVVNEMLKRVNINWEEVKTHINSL